MFSEETEMFVTESEKNPERTIELPTADNPTAKSNSVPPETIPVLQQMGILNLRVNDMMTQLNTVIKMMLDENSALKKENAELKTKQEKTSKS